MTELQDPLEGRNAVAAVAEGRQRVAAVESVRHAERARPDDLSAAAGVRSDGHSARRRGITLTLPVPNRQKLCAARTERARVQDLT